MTTFPYDAIEPFVRTAWERQHLSPDKVTVIGWRGQLAAVLGVKASTINRWPRDLTAARADRIACALDLHPAVVWPDWWDAIAVDDDADLFAGMPLRPYAPCGTTAAAARHRHNGEPLCEPCRLARNAAQLERRRASGVQPRELQPCGTYAAAARHRRRGERPCPACLTAEAEYTLPLMRSWRERNAESERARLARRYRRQAPESLTPDDRVHVMTSDRMIPETP